MENNTEDIGTYKDVQNKLISDNQEFFILPNAKNLGLVDGLKAMENLSIIVNRAKKALENHFYIEFISLKIQYLEFLLRIYWVIKNPDNNEITSTIEAVLKPPNNINDANNVAVVNVT